MLETLPMWSNVQPQLQPHPLLQEDIETRKHPESESPNGEFRWSASTPGNLLRAQSEVAQDTSWLYSSRAVEYETVHCDKGRDRSSQ